MTHLPQAVDEHVGPRPTRLDRYGILVGWALYPLLALLVLVDLRIGIHGKPAPVSAQLVGFSLLTVATAPFWWLRRAELSRTGRMLLLFFVPVLGYALVSSLVTRRPYLQWIRVEREYLVLPVVTAVVTLTAAWGMVLAVPAARRRSWLWWGAVVVVVTTLVEWPRMALGTHDVRLATGMGGAATIHVVLLLCAAVLAGSALEGHRRRVSWAGAVLSLVLLLATGSRAGLMSLVVAAGLLVLWAAARGLGRIAWVAVGAAVAVLAVLLAVVPTLRRMLVLSDSLRQANLDTAMRVFRISWHNMVFGAGEGRLWPWYAFETGRLRVPWRGQVFGEFGYTQTSPHSTFLGIMVELGLLCLALYVCFTLVQVRRLVVEWRADDDPMALVVSVAVVAGILANFFDTYLLKNFGVSLWWWLVVATVLGTVRRGPEPLGEPAPATSARP